VNHGTDEGLDLLIVGGGIGGVICLKYARDAGLNALVLERGDRVGGLWRDLPAWQDIQFRREDWTLGNLPLAGESQPDILSNIEAWVERFDLAPYIRVNTAVTRARPLDMDSGWELSTAAGTYRAPWLIAATGGHNCPVVPQVGRVDSSVTEYHSSALRDAGVLRGKRVTVVGGGASAFDLLDLSFANGASSVVWVYRSTKWMRPTRRSKHTGTDMRTLAKYQMLCLPESLIFRLSNKDLRARYARAGINAILPERDFDIRRDQLIPGRPGMIEHFSDIERHQSEVRTLRGNTIELTNGDVFETDLLLWGTGYSADFGYLGLGRLDQARNLNEIGSRCYSGFLSADAPNLFLLAPGVLDTNTSTPWAYAHVARSIMSHIGGRPVFVRPPSDALTNHFDLVKLLAPRDRHNYWFGLWYLKYLWLALGHPWKRPMPIP
jgi:cation diffusion facilitator CzcD-associated flavoprotein CzcO